jgi:hypothetical protein
MQTDPTQAGPAAQTSSIAAEYFGRPLEAATVHELAGELHVAVDDLVAASSRAELADQDQRIHELTGTLDRAVGHQLLVREAAGWAVPEPAWGATVEPERGWGR